MPKYSEIQIMAAMLSPFGHKIMKACCGHLRDSHGVTVEQYIEKSEKVAEMVKREFNTTCDQDIVALLIGAGITVAGVMLANKELDLDDVVTPASAPPSPTVN